jgi:hypothetical protein
MNAMAVAMQKAGIISDQDFARVKKETEAQTRAEQERRQKALRWESALSGMVGLRTEIETHLREYPESIPVELVEKWVWEIRKEKHVKDQHRVATRHWAMYLNHFRESLNHLS